MRFQVSFCPVLVLVFSAAAGLAAPRVRPPEWASPVIGTTLDNCYRVSADLYRCEQPAARDIDDFRKLGIRSVLNFRMHHTDGKEFLRAGYNLYAEPMNAGEVTVGQLVAALRRFRAAPKPVIVHCWHGSDRTGVFVAAYRIVFLEWTREAALDEFRNGGFGFHEKWYPNLVRLLATMDIAAVRKSVMD